MAKGDESGSVIETEAKKIHCSHCQRYFKRSDFYIDKNGNPMTRCKQCMASLIDLNSPSTVMNILEEIDIPFIPYEWNTLRERYEYTEKNGQKTRNPRANQSVLGRYIGKMKLTQFKDLVFADTDKLVKEYEDETEIQKEKVLDEVRQMLDAGYDPSQVFEMMQGKDMDDAEKVAQDDFGVSLTKDQLRDLKMKWGSLYTEEELIRLETFYSEMHESYDISSASHEDYLKQIVKMSLRMNSLIDTGMYDEYQKISGIYDRMMKSAKFTASQEKEEERFIDSISEMVRLCEEQGFIPQYHMNESQDIVDVTLRDFTNYVRNLVANELNLDALMEKGLEQIKLDEEKEKMSADDALFDDDDDIPTDDELLFETIFEGSPDELTDDAKEVLEHD